MMNIAIYYVITVLYFLVGYLICIGSISTIEKDKVLYGLYKQLSTGFKTILFLLNKFNLKYYNLRAIWREILKNVAKFAF